MTRPAASIAVNGRVLTHQLTGVQRYTREILQRLPGIADLAPERWTAGPKGHAWEQLVLPTRLGGRLLWSPSNTGPLAVRHQVVTCHDVSQFDDAGSVRRSFASWYQFLLPRLYPRVKAIVAISEFTRARILDLFPVDPSVVHVVPNGVGEAFYPRAAEECAAARDAYGLPERFVLTLGSLQPRKNLGRLLQAWDRLDPRLRGGCILAIAGAEGHSQVFRSASLSELPPGVRLLGRIPDDRLPALMSAATAFVYPSYYEGFGLPPLEAMACGTPVVVGDRTSLPEVVGDAGLLVDPFDVEAIAAAIEAVVGDDTLRGHLSLRGVERAAAFTWDRAARMTLDVLEAQAGS